MNLLRVTIADRRDQQAHWRDEHQDAERDQHDPAAFFPLAHDLADKDKAASAAANVAPAAPHVRVPPVLVRRMCWRMARPMTMIGMNTPTP